MTIDGVEYGRFSSESARLVEIRPDEVIEEIQYNKAVWWWKDAICSLSFITNQTTYSINWSDQWKAVNPNGRYGYCGTTKYSVRVPQGQNLNNFFNSSIIFGTNEKYGPNYIIGFKNEGLNDNIKNLGQIHIRKNLKFAKIVQTFLQLLRYSKESKFTLKVSWKGLS